jgi:hypothetical protein
MVDRRGFIAPGRKQQSFGKYEIRITKCETNIKFECSNALNGGNKSTKFDKNNGSNRIVTVSGVKVIGFCHWYFYYSNLFRASCFGFRF